MCHIWLVTIRLMWHTSRLCTRTSVTLKSQYSSTGTQSVGANIGRLIIIVSTRFSIFITKRERACLLRKLSELGAGFSENVVRTTSFNRSSIKNVLTARSPLILRAVRLYSLCRRVNANGEIIINNFVVCT